MLDAVLGALGINSAPHSSPGSEQHQNLTAKFIGGAIEQPAERHRFTLSNRGQRANDAK